LLILDFVTVSDYLFLLRSVCTIMESLKETAMYFLAAAVSDFFIPMTRMVTNMQTRSIEISLLLNYMNSSLIKVEHKIQSAGGGLTLTMDQVPKFLKPMVTNWVPRGFIVSFKVIILLSSRRCFTCKLLFLSHS